MEKFPMNKMVNTYPGDIISNSSDYDEESVCWKYMKRFCLTYFPILTWLPKYTLYNLQCDFIAGVTVGLMVIPQGIAYASIARLSNDYGLYSSFMGCFVYCIFGTSKDITIGPTAILSLMVSTYNLPHCGDMAVLLAFCVGVILLIMGIFRLGFLVRFVSVPVISAFTSAAAITIACGQLKSLNGVKDVPRDFFPNIIYILKRIKDWNYYDFGYGIACIVVLVLMRLFAKLNWQDDSLPRSKALFYKFLWLVGIARNAILVIISCAIMYSLDTYHVKHHFTRIEDADFGLPGLEVSIITISCIWECCIMLAVYFSFLGAVFIVGVDWSPNFTLKYDNKTYEFKDSMSEFSTGLAVVPLLAFMEAVAIGKAFGRVNNYKIIPNQELIALGMSNIFGSLVSSYPVTGSFSRTAVNSQSGVKTPLAGLFTGTVVLLATKFLTAMFQYIPKACLGAVIISAVIPMVDAKVIKSIWNINRIDIIPFLITFLACFYTLEVGLILGILVSLVLVLYPVVIPTMEEDLKEITIIRLQNGLMYPGIQKVVDKVEDIIRQRNPPIAIIIDMSGVTQIDFSVVIELQGLLQQVRSRLPGTELLVTNTCYKVKRVLIMAGLHDVITSSENVSEQYEEGHSLLYD